MAPPITPDYFRVGSRIFMVTWPRLMLVAGCCFLLVLIAGPSGVVPAGPGGGVGALDSLDNLSVPAPPSVLRRAASAINKKIKAIAGVKPAGGKAVSGRKVLTGMMRPWCTATQPNTLGASAAWKTAALGNPGWPVAGNDTVFCDWAEKTTTDVSFKVCTFPRDLDTQVSAYIHKEGHWSGWKKGLVQEMLPVLRSGAAWKGVEGRTLVLDIGANLGFYTLLAGTRGYDVFTFEPSDECIDRLLFSLEANGIFAQSSTLDSPPAQREPFASLEAAQAAKWEAAAAAAAGGGGTSKKASLVQKRRAAELDALKKRAATKGLGGAVEGGGGGGEEEGSEKTTTTLESSSEQQRGGGGVRQSIVWAFQNAASDTYSLLPFEFVGNNPGASFVPFDPEKKRKETIGSVIIDDLLSTSSREPGVPPPSRTLPTLDPERVRLIKVSAEGMDSRVVHGIRRLLSVGRVPFLVFVYNDAHIREHGCNPTELVGTLVDHGYRMYHAGIFYTRPEDVTRFLKGQSNPGSAPRSVELVFVGPGVEWY